MDPRIGAAAATVLALVSLTATAASAQAASIFTLAGAADPSVDCPDRYTTERARWIGLPASEVAGLCAGPGLAALPNGDIVLGARGKLVRIDGNGVVHHLAGRSTTGPLGDGGQAMAAALQLGDQGGLTVDATGGVLVTDTSDGDRLRRIAPDGTITTVAGNGGSSFSAASEVPDGAPATSGPLPAAALAPTADGGFALVTSDYARIRAVGPDGIVTTLAGGEGQPPLPGDVTALAPMASGGLAFAADGTVYALEPGGGARRLPGFPAGVYALAPAPGGALLAGTPSQAWLVEPSGATRLVAGVRRGSRSTWCAEATGACPTGRASRSPRATASLRHRTGRS
jgi:hypothetical protein